jgi:quercetin dioxygenase-like cupin family protein
MASTGLQRRSFLGSLFAVPFSGVDGPTFQTSPRVMKVAAEAGRADDVIKLPGGDLVYVKVATQDTGGALFMTEQPIDRRGSGPPRHYHEDQDEWFYCLAGAYVVEVGDQRFRLGPGESVLGPRRVPHAFVYDGSGPGRILIGFTPAGRIEQFFRDLEKRGKYFGNGTAEDRETAHRLYGVVNVGPPLKL